MLRQNASGGDGRLAGPPNRCNGRWVAFLCGAMTTLPAICSSCELLPHSPRSTVFRLQVGDVIVTKDSETPDDIGIPAVVDYAAPDLICGYHLGLIRPKLDHVDPTFLAKQLAQPRLAFYFGQQANGLTRYGLPLAAVQKTPLWLPGIHEQKTVGVVLRLVDEAITTTEAVIAKLKQVRGGLLRDLLTLGLENSQVRDPVAHPEQFQDSPLGQIPKAWEIRRLGACSELVTSGSRGLASYYSQNGALFLRIANLTNSAIT
jgi:type I restriction enzyme, S subunit